MSPQILLVVEQCNPDWPSVPLVGYRYARAITERLPVHLVTHIRNAGHLRELPVKSLTLIEESDLTKRYYRAVEWLTTRGRVNWPLQNALTYPIYAEFNTKVYRRFAPAVRRGEYDLVHILTPMMPRYPVALHRACQQVPFLLGPVNGGVPFPPGFSDVARQESAQFNFLRAVGRALIPGYVATYKRADRVLVGSSYTRELLQTLFDLPDERLQLHYENGIDRQFLDDAPARAPSDRLELLFVGRLVPYKGADMAVEALGNLPLDMRDRLHLTIVGDGSERAHLEAMVAARGLDRTVTFAGWVQQAQTLDYYRRADLFCFPSVREFGGAVVLEAMACGLPCIVVDHGGIGEYVTEATGYKIAPTSRAAVVRDLSDRIATLAADPERRAAMSAAAIARAREFTWDAKADRLVAIYSELLASYEHTRDR